MIHDFIYDIPVRVYFGRDQLKNLGAELKKHGTRVLMTYGGGSIKKTGLYDRVVKEIKDAGLELFELSGIEPNPRVSSVREGAEMCKEHHIDVLLAVGGGSTIDATKFMAAGACVEHDNYEARANLMWASSWAINGFVNGGKRLAWSCHPMEHELSAIYDITHGLGLAILTPRWMEYCLDETNVPKYVQFGTNVFGIDPTLAPMDIARKAIECLSDFLFNILQLKRTFPEVGIDRTHFAVMARKSVMGGTLPGFKPLQQADVEKIFEMCMN